MTNNTYSFTPQPNITLPGYATSPFGAATINPEGSTYASTYTHATTDLVRKYVENQIFDATNKQYKALYTFMYRNAIKEVGSTQHYYKENVFGREAMTVFGWVDGTQTITLAGTYAAATDVPVSVGDVIVIPQTNRPVMVRTITWSAVINSTTIVVGVQNGTAALGAGEVVAADVLSLQAPIIADGMDTFSHFDRMPVVDRYNYIQMFQRNRRWGNVEYLEMVNNATTDFMNWDKANQLEQLRVDAFTTWINGTRGEINIPRAGGGNLPAKMMGGIYPTMVAAGAPSTSTTLSGLPAAFETLGFQTNTLAVGAQRIVLGTDAMLYELSKSHKTSMFYTPNDKIANLNLEVYKLGTMDFVPIPCPLFDNSSVFPEFFSRTLMVIDLDTITPVKLRGMEHISMGQTNDMANGTRETYTDWWVKMQFGMQFNNPQAGFIINIL